MQQGGDLDSVENNGSLDLVIRQAVEDSELVDQQSADDNKVQHGDCSAAVNEDLCGLVRTACLHDTAPVAEICK